MSAATVVKRSFWQTWYRAEIIPIYITVGSAVGLAGWYLSRLARGPEVKCWSIFLSLSDPPPSLAKIRRSNPYPSSPPIVIVCNNIHVCPRLAKMTTKGGKTLTNKRSSSS
ncbi:hypothetical protein BC938DRAFT_478358 [Jimgerdemannia flammicorona]|uniref:Uncharacterized protein n=1 Tax=Jimgerdemannia flammicorona TaxID=994334 RepID=A0A433P5R5_9FUNG|nr:hypothetical protein BC938DRAFT_478358 [Jimgerdemannia flammicorona]